MLHVSLSGFQFVELGSECVENGPYGSVICKHHATDLVLCGHVGTLLCESYLDGCRSPWNEVGQLAFSDTLEGLMDLRGIDVSLNNVQNGDVGTLLYT